MINLLAELGWISENLPLSPRASGQVFTLPLLAGLYQIIMSLILQPLKLPVFLFTQTGSLTSLVNLHPSINSQHFCLCFYRAFYVST